MAKPLALNVDDTAAQRYAKSRVLQRNGFEVIEAGTGAEALHFAKERLPDIVLLDIKLPDMTGLDVCRILKTDPLTRRIPVLQISATYVKESDELLGLESGADVYLAEPVDSQALVTVVRTLLRLRKTEVGLAESEERMRLAMEGAGVATWEIDMRSGVTSWSPELYRILGCEPDRVQPSFAALLERTVPEDRARVQASLESARAGKEAYSIEFRIARPGGEIRHLARFARLHQGPGGEMTRLIGVIIDITARREAELEREKLLRMANEARAEAEEAARVKDEFLATLSHELRTPMTAMLGWLQLLRAGRLDPDQSARALDTVERNARLQKQLINELLDVSSIVSGKLVLEPRAVPLCEPLEAAIDGVRLAAEEKQVELRYDPLSAAPLVHGDPDRLQQIFSNLLSNGIKFTPAGGRVEVSCRREGADIEISVSDTGEGMPKDLLPHVFDRFRQADGSARRKHGGLGLGLSIVRSLVSLHGGSVRAQSGGPGKGSTFAVRLPLAQEWLAEREISPTPRPQDSAASYTSLDGIRVLAIDDDLDLLEAVGQMLRMQGAGVFAVSSAKQALEALERSMPDIVVMDIGMPGEDGYDLLPRLRSRLGEAGRDLPVIAVTGYASPQDSARALEAGFQAHLPKPFEMEELFSLVRRLAGQRVRLS